MEPPRSLTLDKKSAFQKTKQNKTKLVALWVRSFVRSFDPLELLCPLFLAQYLELVWDTVFQ